MCFVWGYCMMLVSNDMKIISEIKQKIDTKPWYFREETNTPIIDRIASKDGIMVKVERGAGQLGTENNKSGGE